MVTSHYPNQCWLIADMIFAILWNTSLRIIFSKLVIVIWQNADLLYPSQNEVVGGILVSLRLSVRLSVIMAKCWFIIQQSCWGGYWFHSVCLSVCLSVGPSVCPSVRPASRVCSVAPRVLVGSTSYLYILSSNFRRCVTCKVSCKIIKLELLAIFKNF